LYNKETESKTKINENNFVKNKIMRVRKKENNGMTGF
jgi:hypothetical protein